jgi:hypothetical protein
MVFTYLGKPGFLTGYVAQTVKDGAALDRDAAGADLAQGRHYAADRPQDNCGPTMNFLHLLVDIKSALDRAPAVCANE